MSSRSQVNTLFTALVIAIASIGTNAAIPTVPGMEADLGLSSGTGARIVSAFAFGYAIGHLVLGLIADRANQRTLLIICFVGFILASLLPTAVDNQSTIIWARLAQGLFASAGPVIGRSIIRASGDFDIAARKMSSASAVFTWAPVIAPALAGALASAYGWRSVYLFLAAYGATVCWLAIRAEQQWFPDRSIHKNSVSGIGADLLALLNNRSFQCGIIVATFVFGGFLAILAATSDLLVLQTITGGSLTALVTIIAAAYAIGGTISRVLLNRYRSEAILKYAVVFSAMSSAVALTSPVFGDTPTLQFSAIVIYGLCAGIVNPNATILAMRDMSGTSAMAAALVGSGKMLAASAAAAVLALETADLMVTLSWILFWCSLCAMAGLAIRPRHQP